MNSRFGESDHIRAQNTCNGTAGADHGNLGCGFNNELSQSGTNAASQVKYKIFDMAQNTLNIVSENVKEPHIPDDVCKSAVHEHGRENSKWIEFRWDKTKSKYQCCTHLRISPRNKKLSKENHNIHRNDTIGDKREKDPWVIIFIREKH